jgi:catechol 2,3-dioxygenase-like lactoylglutathione lyase family enzyme
MEPWGVAGGDLAAATRFYRAVFGVPVAFTDADPAVFRFANTLINLLAIEAARVLIAPAVVAPREAGGRTQLTITVDDVNATCAALTARDGAAERPAGSALGHPDR